MTPNHSRAFRNAVVALAPDIITEHMLWNDERLMYAYPDDILGSSMGNAYIQLDEITRTKGIRRS